MADEISIVVRAEDRFSSVLGNFGSIITGIESAINLAGQAFRAFTGFAMEGLNAIAVYERLNIALTTLNASQMVQAGLAEDMTSAMQASSSVAEELLGWMQDLAIHSPFTLEGVANAFRLAMAYGFTADEAQRLTQALIDFSAGTGATEYNMTLIARALGQISTAGKLTGQDMLQLTSAGLPVAQILADAFGVTTNEIIRMRSEGLLPAQEVIEAITIWIETNFKGAADAFSTSWAGLLGTFQDLKQMGLREFFGGLFDVLQPLAIQLSEWLQGPGLDQIREWGVALGEFTQNIVDHIPDAVVWLGELRQIFLDEGWASALQFISETIQNIFSNLTQGMNFGDIVQKAVDALTEVLGLANWQGIGEVIGNVLSIAIEAALSGLDVIVNQIDWGPFGLALKNAISEMWAGAFEDTSLSQSLKNAISWLWTGGREEIVNEAQLGLKSMGMDIVEGLVNGIADWLYLEDWNNFCDKYIVNPIKRALGIGSPSTVFYEIGRDIVLGLIGGIGSMIAPLLTVLQALLAPIMALLNPVLELLGFDTATGTGGASATSTLGNVSTVPLSTANTINNNFYGPVYFGNMEQLGYDCPSPHPLVAASGKTLLTSVNIG